MAARLGILLACAAPAAVWFSTPSIYQAQVWLTLDSQKQYVAFPLARDDGDRFLRTQIDLIQSPIVLGRVLGQPEVARLAEVQASNAPVKWLAKRVKIHTVDDSDLFSIEFGCSDAAGSSTVTNAILDAYLKIQSDTVNHQTQRIIALLEQERERRRQGVERQRKNVRVLALQRNGTQPVMFDPMTQETVFQPSPLPDLLARLTTSELDRAIEEATLLATEDALTNEEIEISAEAVDEALDKAPELQRLSDFVADHRDRLAILKTTNKENQPAALSRAELILTQAEERLVAAREELRPKVTERLTRDKMREREARIDEMQGRINNAHLLEEVLAKRISQEQDKLEARGNQSLDLEFAQADLARAQTIYTKIADRLEELKTELQAPQRITPLQRAIVPTEPLRVVDDRQLLSASFAGFMFPFVAVLAWSIFIPRRRPSETVVARS